VLKRPITFALLFVAVLGRGADAHRHVPNELADAFAASWGNAQQLSRLWTETGDIVFLPASATAPSALVEGQKAIADLLRTQFSAALRETSYKITATPRVRQLSETVAIVDFPATVQGTGVASLEHRVTMVVVRSTASGEEPKGQQHQYHWSIAALRMMLLRQSK
jgi:hypothetical protein